MLNKCDSSSRIIYFACLLTNFSCFFVFFFSCASITFIWKCKMSSWYEQNPPAFSGACCTCLYSGLDPGMAFPCTGGGEARAHLGQAGGDEPWPGLSGGKLLFPCQSSSFGSATARCEQSRWFPNPDTWQTPWNCTSKPRIFGQWRCSGNKLLLCKLCKALPAAWLVLVLAKAFSEDVLGWLFLGTWSNVGVKTRCLKQGSDKCKKKPWKMRRQGS